ncbi:hypothetical protein [Granulicella paludicola]|uniref:hypothetical protein n=1 Tax=Granulicella paludicola TaxID=474951 RepID=UPI0021DF7913|nr:hypothetical protein [Granulicella paludicola]
MSRALDPALAAALSAGVIVPAILLMLTFKSGTRYVWSGVGNLVYDAQTYLGVGSLGSIGTIIEGTEVKADGTSVKLSGIDPVLQGECLTDIQLGAPAKIWFALFSEGTTLIGAPYLLFAGAVDKPTVIASPGEVTISLALENSLINLQRANQRRYTSADQREVYPTDTAFGWVEQLQDQALSWGA